MAGAAFGMKKLLLLVLLSGCDVQAFAPGAKCWYRYTASQVRTDTMWNQVQGSSMPYVLVTARVPTDSVRVCR